MKPDSSTGDILAKLAKLAKLTVSKEESDRLEKDLDKMIHFVDQINTFSFAENSSSSTQEPDQLELLRRDEVVTDQDWSNLPRNFRVKRVVT